MKRILKDQDGNIFSAEIVSSIPDGFTDITDELVSNPDVDGVDYNYLEAIDVAEVPQFWTRDGFSDSPTVPTFDVDTWIKDGSPDLTVAPPDVTYTLHLAGSNDERWIHTPTVLEFWERDGFSNVASQPIFDVDTWIKDGEVDVTVDPVDETYTLMTAGSVDSRWTFVSTVPEFWSRAGFADVLSQPVFDVDTWVKEGEADLTVQPIDASYTLKYAGETDSRWTHVPAVPAYKFLQKKSSWVLYDKGVRIAQAYAEMNTEVLSAMTTVFGTSKTDSATAYNETWKMMSASPSDWSGAGLKSAFVVAGFAIGDALDDDVKIAAYANAKLAESLAYGIWRMQRIDAFKSLRDSILAE